MFDLIGFDPSSYSIGIELFIRLLGALYIVVYLPFIFQMVGLFGKEGILPIGNYLHLVKARFGKKGFYYIPSLFWLSSNDGALLTLAWSGLILGGLLMFGVIPLLILPLLYLIHLSLTSAGQEFLSFGWEMFLLEITIGIWLVIATTPYNTLAWIGFNVLLFRFYFQAGISKIFSQDPNWRNLTALKFHYLSQPLPNAAAWFFHKLPMSFHKLSTLYMFFVEIVVIFGIFAPPPIRLFVFSQLFLLQLFIYLTGNFSYLNHMSVIASVILIHNQYFEPYLTLPSISQETHILLNIFIGVLGGAFLAFQLMSFWQTFFRRSLFNPILDWISPFHLAVPHGIFAIMTTVRHEIVIEGSRDGKEWKEYEFYFKAGDLAWRPRRISPFQPRLDWQAWFLPFGRFRQERWFELFLIKLLQGSTAVTKLLKINPFPASPPLFIRALTYDYEYTSFEEKAKTGNWWKRRLIGIYCPPLKLSNK